MSWSVERANEVFELFKQQAVNDAAFRALALENPARAVNELSGMDLPENVRLSVTENAQGELLLATYFSKPAALGETELSEEELLNVTGGISFSSFVLYGPPYNDRKK